MALLSDRELLARLIGFDTVSSRPNAPLADWIAGYLDRPGVWIARQEGPEPGKVNLVAVTGPDAGAANRGPDAGAANRGPDAGPNEGEPGGLTLCGHLDVVPADGPGWTSDPFELVERDGHLVGRGTADMKGFCALAINRFAAVDPGALRAPLGLLFTFDEETGSLGARHFVERPPSGPLPPRHVIVGEPTSLRPVRMHKGHRKLRVTIHGRSAHSGSPHLGVNAVARAGTTLLALESLARAMESEPSELREHFPEVPFPVLSVTGIRGGEAENVIPARCEIDVGLRVLPGMDPAQIADRVARAVGGASGPDAGSAGGPESGTAGGRATVEVITVSDNPPLLTPPEAPLYRTLSDLLDGRGSSGVSFASDAGWLSTAGYECVLFGPGSIDVAHRPDERLPIREFRRAGRLVEALIEKMCGGT